MVHTSVKIGKIFIFRIKCATFILPQILHIFVQNVVLTLSTFYAKFSTNIVVKATNTDNFNASASLLSLTLHQIDQKHIFVMGK